MTKTMQAIISVCAEAIVGGIIGGAAVALYFQNKLNNLNARSATEKSKSIVTQRLEVIDSKGKVRARIDSDLGYQRLALFDKAGIAQAQLVITDQNEPALLLGNQAEYKSAKPIFMVENSRWPALLLYGKGNDPSAMLEVDLDDLPRLILNGTPDEGGCSAQATLYIHKGEIPKLSLTNSNYDTVRESPGGQHQ
jgi:hypothetical protein